MERLSKVLDDYFKEIEEKHHFSKDKLLLATSICADESNHTTELNSFTKSLFHLGGLSGYPFAGITGLNAFLDHIPDGGSAVVIYGPHIGKNKKGELGFMQRYGQEGQSPTCGALWGVVNTLNDYPDASFANELDQQFGYLIDKLNNEKDTIGTLNIESVTKAMFQIIHNNLMHIIEKSKLKKYDFPLFLLGGTIINAHDGNYFEVKEKKTV